AVAALCLREVGLEGLVARHAARADVGIETVAAAHTRAGLGQGTAQSAAGGGCLGLKEIKGVGRGLDSVIGVEAARGDGGAVRERAAIAAGVAGCRGAAASGGHGEEVLIAVGRAERLTLAEKAEAVAVEIVGALP